MDNISTCECKIELSFKVMGTFLCCTYSDIQECGTRKLYVYSGNILRTSIRMKSYTLPNSAIWSPPHDHSDPLTISDFPTDQTFHLFHDLDTELDLHRIMSGFHVSFATYVACQQGTLTLPDTWFRPPFWDLLVLQLLRPDSSNL